MSISLTIHSDVEHGYRIAYWGKYFMMSMTLSAVEI